jgi:hypothetical protein
MELAPHQRKPSQWPSCDAPCDRFRQGLKAVEVSNEDVSHLGEGKVTGSLREVDGRPRRFEVIVGYGLKELDPDLPVPNTILKSRCLSSFDEFNSFWIAS